MARHPFGNGFHGLVNVIVVYVGSRINHANHTEPDQVVVQLLSIEALLVWLETISITSENFKQNSACYFRGAEATNCCFRIEAESCFIILSIFVIYDFKVVFVCLLTRGYF